MSRTSNDQYKLVTGEIIELNQMQEVPQGAILWNGYDYEKQYWVYNGERDTRTLEELQSSLATA